MSGLEKIADYLVTFIASSIHVYTRMYICKADLLKLLRSPKYNFMKIRVTNIFLADINSISPMDFDSFCVKASAFFALCLRFLDNIIDRGPHVREEFRRRRMTGSK